jgi:hypothetical protein
MIVSPPRKWRDFGMRRWKMPKRVDANQLEIVAALRQFGASVQILSSVGHGCPDLLVAFRGKNYVMEVKMPGGKLTKDEYEWHHEWHGDHYVVHSVEEAIAVITEAW